MPGGIGTILQRLDETAKSRATTAASAASTHDFSAVLAHTMMHVPPFSLRGGTRDILRGIIARGLGLR